MMSSLLRENEFDVPEIFFSRENNQKTVSVLAIPDENYSFEI